MIQVESPKPGTYFVYEPFQHPFNGVEVTEYVGGIWRCLLCSPKRHWTSVPFHCKHIRLAKQFVKEEGR